MLLARLVAVVSSVPAELETFGFPDTAPRDRVQRLAALRRDLKQFDQVSAENRFLVSVVQER